MPKIEFVREGKTIEVPAGSNLRRVAREAGIDVYYRFVGCPNFLAQNVLNCHGLGLCGTCGVHLVGGSAANAKPASARERIRVRIYDPFTPHLPAGRIGHEEEFRLSCQTVVEGDLKVVTQPYNWFGGAPQQLDKVGARNPEYDKVLAKAAPLQAKARAAGIQTPIRPGELDGEPKERKTGKPEPAPAPSKEPAKA
jgi:ferredoxin